MPYPASAIAYAFVKKGIEEENYVTQMKLQKMVYLAHGYHLAKYNEPLISEEFEAWKFGPVVQSIYQDYKLYGSDAIIDTGLIAEDEVKLETVKLSGTAIDAIDYTWQVTKHLNASQLSRWSHLDGSPWAQVYSEHQYSIPIKNTSIKEYFKKVLLSSTIAA
ncbi:MAG: hypothetical protein JWR72_150 [Flavisolibacter sp.]|jgi:uncharacterized phage-associated protein|nr:hypothetical protein [Flavisolibacter sp.]